MQPQIDRVYTQHFDRFFEQHVLRIHLYFHILQRVRDESHRFANTFNAELRLRKISESLLDEFPGIGSNRKAALLKHFGSVKRLRKSTAAEIAEVLVEEGAAVKQDQLLIKLRDPNLVLERQRVEHEIIQVQADMSVLQRTLRGTRQVSFSERVQIEGQLKAKQSQQQSLVRQLVIIREKQEQLEIHSPQDGIITTWKPKQRLSMGRPVQRGDLLLEVVDDKGPWIIEAKMPEERMGHVLRAEERLLGQEKLEVEFILASQPDTSYPGIVTEIGHRARLDKDLNVVLLTIEPTLEAMDELKKSDAEFVVAGSEVRAKVNCGVRSLGYVLFVDLIEFVHSRVLF
mgnify:CR=1 FL=1